MSSLSRRGLVPPAANDSAFAGDAGATRYSAPARSATPTRGAALMRSREVLACDVAATWGWKDNIVIIFVQTGFFF